MKDNKIATFLFFALTTFTFAATAQEIKKSIYYATDKFSLSESSKSTLDSLCTKLNKIEQYQLFISGYTDSIASSDYNYELSKKRVKSATDYLVSKNINENKIAASYFGESKQVVSNSYSLMRQKNRRVDILVKYSTQSVSNNSSTAIGDSTEFINNKKIFEKDTIIFCQFGAEIEIRCGTFYPYKIRDIDFNIKEYYSRCDLLNGNITMQTTTGDCLTSGGVLLMRPTVDTLEIQPNKGYKVRIKIPADKNILDKDMKVYFAKNKNGNIVWKLTTVKLSYNTKMGIAYYDFEVDSLAGINIDKNIQVRCEEDGPLVKIKGFNDSKVYLTYPDQMYLSKGIATSGKIFSLVKVAEDKKPTLTVVAEKKGKQYIATGPLLSLDHKTHKNMFIVKKKYFKSIEPDSKKKKMDIEDIICETFTSKDQ